MRKIIVLSMITLDGVMQAPGGPEEDPSGGFNYGGWTAPYGDEAFGKVVEKELKQPAEYLLGRKTFEIWENYWPEHADFWPGINDGTKYVMSETRKKSDWKNTVFIKHLADIKKLKNSKGSDIKVWGSGEYYYPATVEFSRSQSVGSRYADLRFIFGRALDRIGLSKNQR